MTHPQTAPTIERLSPLMQFWGHVGADSAYIRIQRSRLEWSLVGRQWVIEMAPMTSIIAVTADPGDASSSLVVTTVVGSVEFLLPPETAEEAATLLIRLVAEATEQSLVEMATPVVDDGGRVDELINLRWMFDAAAVTNSTVTRSRRAYSDSEHSERARAPRGGTGASIGALTGLPARSWEWGQPVIALGQPKAAIGRTPAALGSPTRL